MAKRAQLCGSVFNLLLASLLIAHPALAGISKEEILQRGQPSSLLATLLAGNGYYSVHVEDAPAGTGVGTYTFTTGASHPAGPGLDILYGGGFPGTSFNTIRSYTTGTDYVQTTTAPFSTNAVVSLDGSGVVTPIGTTGFRTTYTLVAAPDDLTIVSDLNVNGTNAGNSSIEITTTVTNDGGAPVTIGVRYLMDLQINADDGPTFTQVTPNAATRKNETSYTPPAFERYQIQDNQGPATFVVQGTATGPASITPTPTVPSRMQYACWGNNFSSAFDYTTGSGDIATHNGNCGDDSSLSYLFGHNAPSAFTLAPGASVSVSASLFGALEPPFIDPCFVPNSAGVIDLPPTGPNCDQGYVGLEVHQMIAGMPPGTTINISAEHNGFINNQPYAGPQSAGVNDTESFESKVVLTMTGTGTLAGFSRTIEIDSPVTITETGPKQPGKKFQNFSNEMLDLQGEVVGDPDFDLLRITAGTDNGLSGFGETNIQRQGPPGADFEVDSFFDIEYEIEYIGAVGSQLEGMSGTTTSTVRMKLGQPLFEEEVVPTLSSMSYGILILSLCAVALLAGWRQRKLHA
jgi:hypothetical protein